MNTPYTDLVGFTRLVSRKDGITVVCQVCGRDTHLGATIETVRETFNRKVTLSACYDCIEVCGLMQVGRMPCGTCGGDGIAREPR